MYKYFINLLTTFSIPLLAFYQPLQHSLLALGILLLFNFILAVIAKYKEIEGNVIFKLFYAVFNKEGIWTTLKISFDYIVALVLISLFEVYFLGIDVSEISTKLLSFSHLAVVYMASKEVKRGFSINEKITGSNFYEEIEKFIPEKFKNFFKKS